MKKNTPILVTGGAGYIGSHVCKALNAAHYLPVTLDNLVTGHVHAVKWGPFEHGDVLDHATVSGVIQKYGIKATIHLAAHIAVGESMENPGKYYRNNTVGGLSLLETMQELKVKYMVFSSTAAVYGLPTAVPITEDFPLLPINPYGASKVMVEQMLKDYGMAHKMGYVSLRYFNVAGADPEAEIGCEHENPNNLIPVLMQVQKGRRQKLEIFGTDYDTPDGTAIRDYIHVADLAEAHVKALDYLFKGGKSTVCNLGTGKGHSVKEVIDSVSRVTGKKVPVKNAPRRAGDPPILYADATKAKKILGWQARYLQLDEITETAWKWEKYGNK